MKYLIVGGVAGGATAAARIRRADEFANIIIFEKGKYVSYANCGLPYYIGGTISERSNLLIHTPESFGQMFNIDVRTENEVIEINSIEKYINVRRANGEVYREDYDKLLLSPGASPVRPPLKGIENSGIFTLRNVDDTDAIKEYINSHNIKKAVVVGAGFIGLEMAENLYNSGAHVSIVEMGNQVMAPVDYSTASHVHQHLIQKGVDLYLELGVVSFEKEDDKLKVILTNGSNITADIIILSIGVRPETSLAKSAGIKIGETGGICVNEYLETSEKDIYAVGDAIEFSHPITKKSYLNFLANPANRQGRIVADNMVFGNKTEYEGAIGTSIAKVFGITVASTGMSAKKLKILGMEYTQSITHSLSHAGYYPGALPLTTKLIFHPISGKILGAQIVGSEGVDKRIDQIALIIKNKGTIQNLIELEHAYAPPYSSAKDPIAIAGYAANNIMTGAMRVITWREFKEALGSEEVSSEVSKESSKEIILLDVRTKEEYEFGSVNNAVNIPLQELRARINELPKNKKIYIFCAVGLRGYLAQRILMANGYENTWNLSGGYKTYSIATAPIINMDNSCSANVSNDNTTSTSDEHKCNSNMKIIKIDACGLQCPGPIMKLKKSMDGMSNGDMVEIISTDAGFASDAGAWCNSTGNKLISVRDEGGKFVVCISKGTLSLHNSSEAKGKSLIMFSDDLDKALATFVLANGAAATGAKTTIFFTFWGLNVIKKTKKPAVKKDIFGKMFGMMLPSSSLGLKLSKMNMFGVGKLMMRYIMKKKGIDSLESLRQQAIDNGVEFIACQMSMDVMGIKREELLDNVIVGGVATYMGKAENSAVNLFI